MGDKVRTCLQASQVVGVWLEAEDLAILDRLARVHGSRAQALRVLLREFGAPYLELRAELVALRREIASLRAAVEGIGGVGCRASAREEERTPEDEAAVRQVLGALLGMKREKGQPD